MCPDKEERVALIHTYIISYIWSSVWWGNWDDFKAVLVESVKWAGILHPKHLYTATSFFIFLSLTTAAPSTVDYYNSLNQSNISQIVIIVIMYLNIAHIYMYCCSIHIVLLLFCYYCSLYFSTSTSTYLIRNSCFTVRMWES